MPLADRQAIAADIAPDQANLPLLQTPLPPAATAGEENVDPDVAAAAAAVTAAAAAATDKRARSAG
ncbi:TPA: hypothetical protein ACH3X1_002819 [Trebouxia sp. C0004]